MMKAHLPTVISVIESTSVKSMLYSGGSGDGISVPSGGNGPTVMTSTSTSTERGTPDATSESVRSNFASFTSTPSDDKEGVHIYNRQG